MKYSLIKTCKCGNDYEVSLTKKEAAFDLYNKTIWNSRCSKCGSTECLSIGLDKPDFDKELMLEWGNNHDLHFSEQDEDLMLADEKNIDLILDIIDNHSILNEKRNILIEALCVIIYDNPSNNRVTNNVIKELKQRKEMVLLAECSILNYIKKEVFPKIGLDYSKLK